MLTKKKFILFIFIFAFSSLVFASVTLQYFTAKTNADGILVEWKTIDEEGCSSFVIERSANSPDNFVSIKNINASGNNSYYSYQDNGVGYSTKNSSIYYYRLKCVQPSGTYSYSQIISVTHSVSGIKSTWGSIKAIFR